MMIAGNFEPHFSVKHMLKDVRIGLKLADGYGLDLPVTATARDLLLDEMKQGRGDADYSSVAQKYFPAPTQVVSQEDAELSERKRPAWALSATPKGAASAPEPEAEKVSETGNLSGGIRGWFSRRA
jgi:hypothetical protein